MKNIEEHSISTARFMPVKQPSSSSTINLLELESIREMELEKRRERVQMYNSFGW